MVRCNVEVHTARRYVRRDRMAGRRAATISYIIAGLRAVGSSAVFAWLCVICRRSAGVAVAHRRSRHSGASRAYVAGGGCAGVLADAVRAGLHVVAGCAAVVRRRRTAGQRLRSTNRELRNAV